MIVYQTRADGVLVGLAEADPSPLEEGVWLIPGGCVTVEPPSFVEGEWARWDSDAEAWVIEPVPEPTPDPSAPELPDPPPLSRLSKAELWRRLTEEEAELLGAALSAAPTRLRRIFEAAAYLDANDPDYPALKQGIVAALGDARANEVLLPNQ